MKLAIINYPNALQSAVYGLSELFDMTNNLCDPVVKFNWDILELSDLDDPIIYDVVVLPPSLKGSFYQSPSDQLLNWLKTQYAKKAILCSACSGAFILAKSELLKNKTVTTHWALADGFKNIYPEIVLDSQKILINEGDIITAGGVMSWLDLGLEVVAKYAGPNVMMQLGKNLVVDTGRRAQSYYQQFIPNKQHGNHAVRNTQDYIEENYSKRIKISELAAICHMTERSFLRRFHQLLGLTPTEYIQKYRIQKACDQLERTAKSFEQISMEVGYENSSACRKIFVRIIGITPKQFRQRFVK